MNATVQHTRKRRRSGPAPATPEARGAHAVAQRISALTLVATLLVGCSDDELADLQAYVTEVKSRQKSAIEPLPTFKPVEPFAFVAAGRRDPFAPVEKKEDNAEHLRSGGPQPDLARTREALEGFELDSLRMVGTLQLRGGLWGLVKAVDGTIYRVRPGNHMGRNYGRVVKVGPDRIELVELVPAGPGAWEERQAALDLNELSTNGEGRNHR